MSRSCASLRCGYFTDDEIERCPKCSRKMRKSSGIRIMGVMQLLIGLFLVGLMGVITFRLGPLLLNPEHTEGGSAFTGTAQQGKIILMLFGLVIAVGLVSTLSGLWQIALGRRNKWIVIGAVALGVVLYFFAFFVSGVVGE